MMPIRQTACTEPSPRRPGGQPSAMLPQPEFKTAHENFHRFVLGERSEGEIIPKIVRFNADEKSAGPQDAEHFAQGFERLREMHQHGLAGDDVEAVVGQRQLGGVALMEGK